MVEEIENLDLLGRALRLILKTEEDSLGPLFPFFGTREHTEKSLKGFIHLCPDVRGGIGSKALLEDGEQKIVGIFQLKWRNMGKVIVNDIATLLPVIGNRRDAQGTDTLKVAIS